MLKYARASFLDYQPQGCSGWDDKFFCFYFCGHFMNPTFLELNYISNVVSSKMSMYFYKFM